MNVGDRIYTPRFCTVIIKEILTPEEAYENGYTEPTHYKDSDYKILGKSTGLNHMVFAAVKIQTK